MCIVISGETQPDTTKLMNIPVIMDGEKYNFFMYINNFDLHKDNNNSQQNNLDDMNYKFSLLSQNYDGGKYASFNPIENENNNLSQNNNSIMVVPKKINFY